MTQLQARFKPGVNVSGFATALVRAGRFVKVVDGLTASGDIQIAEAAAGERAFGVAERDSAPATEPASYTQRRVNCARHGAIARVVAGAAVVAPALVTSDAQGRAVTAAGADIVAGQAVSDAAAAGDIVLVDLF